MRRQQAGREISLPPSHRLQRQQRKGRKLRREFKRLVEPWGSLVVRGKRIDLVLKDPERQLRETREGLAKLILEAVK